MTWTPLLSAAPPIPLHAFVSMAAMILGAVQFALPKGTPLHRVLGWLWVGVMAAVALSSFWIHSLRIIGPFSPIHLVSIFVLYSLVTLVRYARAGEIAKHRRNVIQLYVLGLILTGAFTFIPGRIMHEVFFGGAL